MVWHAWVLTVVHTAHIYITITLTQTMTLTDPQDAHLDLNSIRVENVQGLVQGEMLGQRNVSGKCPRVCPSDGECPVTVTEWHKRLANGYWCIRLFVDISVLIVETNIK